MIPVGEKFSLKNYPCMEDSKFVLRKEYQNATITEKFLSPRAIKIK
jgi:hypothetical protein